MLNFHNELRKIIANGNGEIAKRQVRQKVILSGKLWRAIIFQVIKVIRYLCKIDNIQMITPGRHFFFRPKYCWEIGTSLSDMFSRWIWESSQFFLLQHILSVHIIYFLFLNRPKYPFNSDIPGPSITNLKSFLVWITYHEKKIVYQLFEGFENVDHFWCSSRNQPSC